MAFETRFDPLAAFQSRILDIGSGGKFQLLSQVAFDGLTSTYVAEELPQDSHTQGTPTDSTPATSSRINTQTTTPDPTHHPYLLQEFMPRQFPSVLHCERYWENAQLTFKRLESLANSGQMLAFVKPIKSEIEGQPGYYLIFKNVENLVTLKHWFRKSGTALHMTTDQIIEQLIMPLSQFLQSVHDKGVVHRDLNYNTVFVQKMDDGKYRPIIGTWHTAFIATPEQLAQIPDDINELADGEDPVCTPGFYAPEVAMGKRPGRSADIYGTGAIMYYLTTGGASRVKDEIAEDFVLEPAAKGHDVLPEVNLIVRRSTQFEPRLRYHSCADLIKDLYAFLTSDHAALDYLFKEAADEVTELGLDVDLFGGTNRMFIPFDLPKMTLENGGFFRFGRTLHKDLDEAQSISDVDANSEQFIVAYSVERDIFLIFEGRNLYATLLNGKEILKEQWVEWPIDQTVGVDQNTGIKIRIGNRSRKLG